MYSGRREQWKKTKPELITRTVFRCLRLPPHVNLTDEYVISIGKEVAREMASRVAVESGDVGFLPSNWEWTTLFAKHVRACVKPIQAHMASCMDFAALERVLRSAPATTATAPDARVAPIVASANVANEVNTGAAHVSRDAAPIRAARTRAQPVATQARTRPKRARKK